MKSITFLLTLFLLGACTITKRVHNPGWHVEWKSTHSNIKESEQVATHVSITEGQASGESLSELQPEETERVNEIPNLSQNIAFSIEQDYLEEQSWEVIRIEQGASYSSKLDKEKETTIEENEGPSAKKVHPLAKAALISLILSVVTFGLGMLVAIILARYALKKIKSDPEQWTGRKMALTVLIISSVLFIPLMLLILLISIAFNYSSGGWL